jgi:hypothetical protein
MSEPSCLEEDVGRYEPILCSWCNTDCDLDHVFGVGPINFFCSDQCYDEYSARW